MIHRPKQPVCKPDGQYHSHRRLSAWFSTQRSQYRVQKFKQSRQHHNIVARTYRRKVSGEIYAGIRAAVVTITGVGVSVATRMWWSSSRRGRRGIEQQEFRQRFHAENCGCGTSSQASILATSQMYPRRATSHGCPRMRAIAGSVHTSKRRVYTCAQPDSRTYLRYPLAAGSSQ